MLLEAGNNFYDTSNGISNGVIDGGAGDDFIRIGSGAQAISGGTGQDFINVGSGADAVTGGSGNGILNGRGGTDLIDLSAIGIASFAVLSEAISSNGANAVIDLTILGGTGEIIVVGAAELLTQNDLIL